MYQRCMTFDNTCYTTLMWSGSVGHIEVYCLSQCVEVVSGAPPPPLYHSVWRLSHWCGVPWAVQYSVHVYIAYKLLWSKALGCVCVCLLSEPLCEASAVIVSGSDWCTKCAVFSQQAALKLLSSLACNHPMKYDTSAAFHEGCASVVGKGFWGAVVSVWCCRSILETNTECLSSVVHIFMAAIYGYGQPPDCVFCIRQQSPSPGHPSAADEAWYWLKRVLCSGWLYRTSRLLFPRKMWFTYCLYVQGRLPLTELFQE